MSFLDNSGDIILDAVITDAGRKRMAEGKFNIAKYAFGDEEINYGLFNNQHPSGSAFYDLQIMQTPIFEAFTNNTSTMSSKLMSLNDNNYLYLPILRLNENWGVPMAEQCTDTSECKYWTSRVTSKTLTNTLTEGDEAGTTDNSNYHSGMFVVTCDESTEDLYKDYSEAQGIDSKKFVEDTKYYSEGVILGAGANNKMDLTWVCVDQGISGTNTGLSVLTPFPSELRETAYLIRIDHRLGRIATAPQRVTRINGEADLPVSTYAHGGNSPIQDIANEEAARRSVMPYAFVDDDHVATYYVTTANGDLYEPDIKNSIAGDPVSSVLNNPIFGGAQQDGLRTKRWVKRQVFQDGPLGSRLQFTIRAQDTVKMSTDLFDTSKTTSLYRDNTSNATGPADGRKWVVLGGDGSSAVHHSVSVYYIDSTVTVTGVTTGYSLNIPVRFVKRVIT